MPGAALPELQALRLGFYLSLCWCIALFIGRDLVRAVGNSGALTRTFFLWTVFAVIVAHVVLVNRDGYPYIAWNMYSDPFPQPEAWTLVAKRRSGTEEQLNLTRILPGVNARALVANIALKVADWSRSQDGGHDELGRDGPPRDAVRATLSALVVLDSRQRPSDPIKILELQHCHASGRPPWRDGNVRCHTVAQHATAE